MIPPNEVDMLIDNIGIPNSWPAIAQGDIPTISAADGEILISLNKEKHGPTGLTKCFCGSGFARSSPT